MGQRLLYETSQIIIRYDYFAEWLDVEWIGDQDYESVVSGATKMLECVRQERCRKVLNDNTLVTSMWADAAEWGGKEWFPAMREAGCEFFAWVYSPNVYSRLSTDLTLQYTSAGIVVLTFDDITIAQTWLQQM
ncbi:hypothetical protein [Hymenobacter cellulosivorans]|uniref:STAS/SEC14 domain-containing protein n=1 Tax=Hymenobacter cellulosivorans TaxID=2932249 RepID=A0ABY4FAP5_9BACT|nr:hypothetical protein [Hymenobacter cellulosivorans]UOQ53510.1 hypothetical protein MUN80_01825 [Hymenobacter cellulosivorans]